MFGVVGTEITEKKSGAKMNPSTLAVTGENKSLTSRRLTTRSYSVSNLGA